MNYDINVKPMRGGEKRFKKLINSLFSVKNVYKRDNYAILRDVYKEISIFGFKIFKKVKRSQYERYLFEKAEQFLITDVVNDLNYVKCNFDVSDIINSNNTNDKSMVENLYKNLDDEAKNHLDKIISRNERVVKYTKDLIRRPKSYEIYTKEELEELDKSIKFKKEVQVFEDYFKWQDYILPVNWFEPSVFLYKHGIETLKNKDLIQGVIVDAGANIGDSAIVFAKNFPNNKVISFEPIKRNYNLCQKTIMLNKIDNVIIENMGLGDENKISYIKNMGTLGTGSQIMADTGSEKIEMITLDSYVKKNNIKVGLIKTDVEGFESHLLRGAQDTIRTQAPVLLISIYHNSPDFFKLKPMVEEIMKTSEHKYRYDFFQPVYNATIAECLLICEKI